MKKLLALGLAFAMCLSLLTGCSGNNNGSNNSASNSATTGDETSTGDTGNENSNEEPYEVNFAYLVASTGSNMDKVREAMNELTMEELNMTVNLIPMTFSEFISQLPMMLAANEPMDLMPLPAGQASTFITSQYIVDLSPYLDKIPNIEEYVGDLIDAGYVGDFLTGLPMVKEAAYPCALIARQDIMDELGYSEDDFNVTTDDMSSFDQITELFAAVKEAHPEMTVFDGTGIMGTMIGQSYVDTLGDGFGVLADYGQETTVTNMYESDLFRQFCEIGKTWYDAGYSSQDISVNTDSSEVKMKAGNTFATIQAHKPNTKQEKKSQTGYDWYVIPLSEAVTTNSVATLYSVANASKDPAKAVEFLNWAYGSGEFADLINWGIEGEDWVEAEDGTAAYPEGVDPTNVGYHQDMGFMYPNQFAGHVWEGNPLDIWEQYKEHNASCLKSKALGFTYDSTGVVNEITQLTSVQDKYLKDLSFGVVDIDSTLEAFNDELYAAGLQKVMDTKQEQLDAWLAEQ